MFRKKLRLSDNIHESEITIMTKAIRYYSKFGHTRKMAAVVADRVGVPAESIDQPITEYVDVLYFGSAVYATVVDWRVKKFIKTLTPEMVGRVICFSSAAIIESNYPKVKELFEKQGIIAVEELIRMIKGEPGKLVTLNGRIIPRDSTTAKD